MNNRVLSTITRRLLAIAGVDLNIKFYFPLPAPPIRTMAWDCYGPQQAVDATEIARYGGKAYFTNAEPLSRVLAEHQLLMDIAITIRSYFLNTPQELKECLFRAMLDTITRSTAREIDKALYETNVSH